LILGRLSISEQKSYAISIFCDPDGVLPNIKPHDLECSEHVGRCLWLFQCANKGCVFFIRAVSKILNDLDFGGENGN